MFEMIRLFARFSSSIALIFTLGFSAVRAQDSALEDIKYKEDYDRMQLILKTPDMQKRTNMMISMYKDRPDMNADLRKYIDSLFARDLEKLVKDQNYALVMSLSERALKARPRFAEVYFFQGIGLKNLKKNQEAMEAFAKCYVIQPNQMRTKCKQQLDVLYRTANKGSLIGEDKVVTDAVKALR
jgi:hypothetical protein